MTNDDYALNVVGIENWKSTEFVVKNELEEFDFVNVYLEVDWENKIAFVHDYWEMVNENEFSDINMSIFKLDVGIDYTQFEEYYNAHIRPIIVTMGEHYVVTNPLDSKQGYFEFEDDDYENITMTETMIGRVYDAINNAPAHNVSVRWSVEDVAHEEDIVKILASHNIDLKESDLRFTDVVEEIRDALESDLGICFAVENPEFIEQMNDFKERIFKGDE